MRSEKNTPIPWYKAPIAWLGVFLTLLILVACIHIIIVSQGTETQTSGTVPNSKDKAITHVLGMPLHRETQPQNNDTAEDEATTANEPNE